MRHRWAEKKIQYCVTWLKPQLSKTHMEKCIVWTTVKHPVKVHVFGCFSERGFGCLELSTENLNAEKMLKIYQLGFLKSVKMFEAVDDNAYEFPQR